MRYHPKNEVRLLVHLQTHRLVAVPARHVVSGGQSLEDNRQAFPTAKRAVTAVKRRRVICFTPPVICNIVTAPDRPVVQNGHRGGKQPTGKELKIFQHIGSVDREGVAKTRKTKTENNGYSVNAFRASPASISLQWLTVIAEVALSPAGHEKMARHKSCESNRRSWATVGGTYLFLVTISVSAFNQ